jgi:NAD(P)-dependent dehydrogenase (short-subunit alcohol dehydrogenase family)
MKKTILVTGAAGNLGQAVTRKFLEEGYQVAAVDSPRRDQSAAGSDAVLNFSTDLTDESAVEKNLEEVFSRFERVDITVCTVGGFAMGTLQETSADDFDRMYRLNFLTAFNISRCLLPRMKVQQGGGDMVFIGSKPAIDPGLAKSMVAYSLTKSLLFRLAEVINEEGASHHVRAAVVVPGTIDTPQNRAAMPDADFSKWVSPQLIAENIHHLRTQAGRALRESVMKVYGDSQNQ